MTWDDSSVSDEEHLLRRTRPLKNCIGRDSLSKRWYPLPGALGVDKDGMSVYRVLLLESKKLAPAAICRMPDHWVFQFPTLCVRRVSWGVRYDIDDEDELVGFAHSLVLTQNMPPSKAQKMLMREAIAEHAMLALMPEGHLPPPEGVPGPR